MGTFWEPFFFFAACASCSSDGGWYGTCSTGFGTLRFALQNPSFSGAEKVVYNDNLQSIGLHMKKLAFYHYRTT
jgi:hypothetical protein